MAIIPAHNEEMVVANLIESLKNQTYDRDLYDIYVIADNCTDNTANIARRAGAQYQKDLSLVSNEYKTIAEYFYKAVDSSKRFFSKKFRYIQYSSYKLYQKDIISKFLVDFEQEIFNLYHSGNNGIGKSAVKKFMWIGILLALIVFILFKVLIR